LELRLAIVGATGLVGRELLRIMAAEGLAQQALGLFASEQSAGDSIEWQGRSWPVQALTECDFNHYDAAFFCVGDELSAQYVPQALDAGCAVVDKSNTYRLDPVVPLIVPGVNDHAVAPGTRLVANPNCTTIVLMHALAPLAANFGVRSMFVATYQSVSGAGKGGVATLKEELEAVGDIGTTGDAQLDPAYIAFNVLPGIGSLDLQGRAGEEAKLIEESRKILGLPELKIACHAVRVPVFAGHAIAVSVELGREAGGQELLDAWGASPNVKLMDDELPTPVGASAHDCVEVGRIRREPALDNGLSFFVCGDNVNIGAALNGWRILKLMNSAETVRNLAQEG
jgi:aspartate-semialdehyde dehydrogenase